MAASQLFKRFALLALSAAVVAVGAFVAWGNAANGDSSPAANKTWVAGSTMDIMHKQLTEGVSEKEDEKILARNQIKFSNPQDLILSLTAECALWTNTATTGDDDAETKARVETWVTIDNKIVPVSPTDTAANNPSTDPDVQAGKGRVVLCNRASRMKTENIEAAGALADADTEDDIVIRSYNRTREANGFNWAAIDVGRNYDADGDNVVDVVVHARLVGEVQDEDNTDNQNPVTDESGSASPAAMAAVGKRTLVIEPTRMAVRATTGTAEGDTVAVPSALTRARRMAVRR